MFDRKAYSQKYYQEHKDEYSVRKRRYAQEGRYKDHIKEGKYTFLQLSVSLLSGHLPVMNMLTHYLAFVNRGCGR